MAGCMLWELMTLILSSFCRPEVYKCQSLMDGDGGNGALAFHLIGAMSVSEPPKHVYERLSISVVSRSNLACERTAEKNSI
jgi:hypothetical protein